jgi:hypothetical protein
MFSLLHLVHFEESNKYNTAFNKSYFIHITNLSITSKYWFKNPEHKNNLYGYLGPCDEKETNNTHKSTQAINIK